jgi:hypothetical protein
VLEYSLYNLSSFIAATNTDVVDIQGTPTLAWTNPLTTIYYGTTPWVTSGQAATASYNGSTLSSSTGTFTYTLEPPAGAPTAITPTSVLPVGNNEQICATWAPTSATALDYTAVTTPVCTTITVLPDTTATSVTPPSQIYYGQQFTITNPTVTTGGPASLNEGTLTYTITGTLGSPTVTTATICTLSPPSSGTCTSPLPTYYDAGTYTFQACYTDSTGNFANSCSGSYQVTVLPDPTTTTLTSTNDPAIVGSSVTFNAAMTTTYNTTPVGTANFYDGTALLASVTPLSNGTAAYTTSTLIVGPHSITVCYLPAVDPSGSYDFTPVPTCTSPFTQLVILAPSGPQGTVTLLNSSSNPSVFNSAVTFSAAVATTGAFSYIPSGSLTFYDGTTALAPATTLDANGYASLTTSALTVGTHSITAVYAGNTTTTPPFMASTSLPVSQVVTQALPSPGTGFLMQVNPTAISVGVGNTATVSVSITALNNFNQTVQLSCTGMPNESTCNFAQSLIPVGGGITTLTISPSAPHACGANPGFFVGSSGMGTTWPLLAASALGGLLLFRKRKRLGTRIAQGITLALALCVLTAVTGCGGNCTDFGTQPGTYTFTVTGTAGGTTPQVSTQTIQMVVHL